MQHSVPRSPQFYVTAPQPCPYLADRMERKLFTALQGPEAQDLNDTLSKQGFRRSQNVLYRPSCTECAACLSARIRVDAFSPRRTQRRTLRQNADLERTVQSPWATEEQYELFRHYLGERHATGGMAEMDMFEYAAMIEDSPVTTRVIEYRQRTDDRLIAVCLTDVFDDGLSLVYSFFDPTETTRSLGTHMILDHVDLAREIGLPFVYLGYWVPGSPKMGYKARFSGLEVYHRSAWQAVAPGDSFADLVHPLCTAPIAEQVAGIRLPGKPG